MSFLKSFGRPLFLLFLWACAAAAAAQIPAKPRYFFNDYVGIVSRDVVYELNERLAQAERQTSNQILVVIYPRLPNGQVLEEYTLKAFRAWGVGRAARDNGIVLFTFLDAGNGHGVDRLEVGRGLEGPVPDATAKRLLAEVLNPALKRKAYEAGFRAVVGELLRLTGNEFSGDGRTQVETNQGDRLLEGEGEAPDAPLQEAVDRALRILWPLGLGLLSVMVLWKLVSWCRSEPTERPGAKPPSRPVGNGGSGHGDGGFWTGAALGALLSDEGRGSSGGGGTPSAVGDGDSSRPSGFDGGGGTAGGGGASDTF
jgi:uncharacterized protein